jgi:hypothetical protein
MDALLHVSGSIDDLQVRDAPGHKAVLVMQAMGLGGRAF